MVFPENEIVMWILGTGVLIFIFRSLAHLRRLRWWGLLLLAYVLLVTGWCATLLEDIGNNEFWNTVEHTAYALGAVVFALWCWGGMQEAEDLH
jgi:hypothetical protein